MSAVTVERPAEVIRPIRVFNGTVGAVRQLTPHFRRITVTGPELEHFGTNADGHTLDLRIKVMIPVPGHPMPDFGAAEGVLDEGWYQTWLAMDPGTRGYMRTYTVRALRPAIPASEGRAAVPAEVDLDFVMHLDGGSGPAALWASRAQVGDPMVLIGPDARSGDCLGIEFELGAANRVLLVGDETALPAIAGILETLPAHVTGHAVLEVPSAEDFQDLPTPSRVEVRWLARTGGSAGAAPHGELMSADVRRIIAPSACSRGEEPDDVDIDADILWETPLMEPGEGFYAWIAGEAAAVRELRRYLVRDVGVDRNAVAFMGYWRLGKAQAG